MSFIFSTTFIVEFLEKAKDGQAYRGSFLNIILNSLVIVFMYGATSMVHILERAKEGQANI